MSPIESRGNLDLNLRRGISSNNTGMYKDQDLSINFKGINVLGVEYINLNLVFLIASKLHSEDYPFRHYQLSLEETMDVSTMGNMGIWREIA